MFSHFKLFNSSTPKNHKTKPKKTNNCKKLRLTKIFQLKLNEEFKLILLLIHLTPTKFLMSFLV